MIDLTQLGSESTKSVDTKQTSHYNALYELCSFIKEKQTRHN